MQHLQESYHQLPTLLYIPNPHNGYLQFFDRHSRESDTLWIIDSDLAEEFSTLHTEIRAVNPHLIKKMIGSLGIFRDIQIVNRKSVGMLVANKIITASESISRQVVAKYFPKTEVIFDTVFLRYDEGNVMSQKVVVYDRQSDDPFDLRMMSIAYNESEKSSCWWRHVGSVWVKTRKILAVAHNQHVPYEQISYAIGDPRDFIEAGKLSHFASTLHSEHLIFLEALRKGISTAGTDLYVSVFPCPGCAKLVAYSGIKRCFFGSGHASLSGQEDLKSQNVELIYVPIHPHA